jgi:hypothetical protein
VFAPLPEAPEDLKTLRQELLTAGCSTP